MTPAEVVTAGAALQIIDTTDRDEVFLEFAQASSRPVSTTFRSSKSVQARSGTGPSARRTEHRRCVANAASHQRQTARGSRSFSNTGAVRESPAAQPVKVPGASDTESAAEKDFSEFTNEELEEFRASRGAWCRRLARKPSRRWRPVKRGSRVNLRRSLRLSLKTGGELIDLAYKERRPKRTKLVRDLRRLGFDGYLQPAVVAVCLRAAKQFCESRIVCLCDFARRGSPAN